jgi:hypothetical protein
MIQTPNGLKILLVLHSISQRPVESLTRALGTEAFLDKTKKSVSFEVKAKFNTFSKYEKYIFLVN